MPSCANDSQTMTPMATRLRAVQRIQAPRAEIRPNGIMRISPNGE